MPERSRRVLGLLLALGLLAGLSACSAKGPRSEGGFIGSDQVITVVPPANRKPAPLVSGAALAGGGTVTTESGGKVVVVNVWGSWCPPCREEAPGLQAAAEATADKARFVGITTKDLDPAPAQAFVRSFGIGYPSIWDPTGAALLAFSGNLPPNAIPSTLVIDAQGRVAVRVLGTISSTTLVSIIDDVAAGK